MCFQNAAADEETREGVKKLEKWLNKSMKITMTDGRVLIGKYSRGLL